LTATAVPEPIAVASVVDQSFLPMVRVVASSIAAAASSGRPVNYHVIYHGRDSRMSRQMAGWQSGPVRVHMHRLPNPWERFGRIGGFPPSSLSRLSLPEMLPGLSRLIYLDVDVVVQADLGELFDTPLLGQPLGAVRDRVVAELALRTDGDNADQPSMLSYLREIVGLNSRETILDYRQAGVLLMDLNRLRALDFTASARMVVERHGTALRYADQCVINIVLRDRMAVLDPRWNVITGSITPSSTARALPEFVHHSHLQATAPRILHYAGNKPWNRLGLPLGRRWWRQAVASGLGPYFAMRHLSERGRLETAALVKRIWRRRP